MNSIAPLAVRKNYLGDQQPERVAKQIMDIANRFGDYKLNTSYQRENCWNQITKNGLISSSEGLRPYALPYATHYFFLKNIKIKIEKLCIR